MLSSFFVVCSSCIISNLESKAKRPFKNIPNLCKGVIPLLQGDWVPICVIKAGWYKDVTLICIKKNIFRISKMSCCLLNSSHKWKHHSYLSLNQCCLGYPIHSAHFPQSCHNDEVKCGKKSQNLSVPSANQTEKLNALCQNQLTKRIFHSSFVGCWAIEYKINQS